MKYNSSFLFLLSLASSSSRSWSLFLDMGVRYSANSTLSCCTASSLEPCTLYIHMKGSLFFVLLGKYASVRYFFVVGYYRCHFLLLCFFCHISVALFKPKDMLAILPHKITASWNAKKIIKSDALLQISSHAPSGESLSDFASVFLKLSYHLLWH